jgi:hypothetical protein
LRFVRGTEALVLVRGFRAALVLLASWAALAMLPGRAYAELVLLMPADSDAGLAAHAITAHAAVARALEAQGVELLSYAAARERAGGGELADCKVLTCSAELCKKAKAELVVMVAVRSLTSEKLAKPREVQVTLVDPNDARFFGRAEVRQGDFSEAAREALLDARAYQLLGPGPHVRVESVPEGADVTIDDQLAGQTPYRAPIAPGKHTVEVSLTGYKTQGQMIDVPRGAQQPVRISVELQARAQPSGQGTASEIEADIDAATTLPPKRSTRPIIGPLILGVVGLGLITYDVVLIAASDCERNEPVAGDTCTLPTEIDPAPAIVIGGVGVAALGAGILWFVLGADADDSDEPVSARISPLGAELRAKF